MSTDSATAVTAKKQINWIPVILALAIMPALCVFLVIDPVGADQTISTIKTSAVHYLTPFYLWLGIATVGYLLFFVFSKYGGIRLGAEKPEFRTFSWIVMMFCAGMGSSLLYWSALEWVYYYSGPPLGAPPFSQLAAELSMVYGNFHWSITAWGFFAVGAIPLGIRFYVLKKPGLSLTLSCERVIGEKNSKGILGKIIEVVFIFGILGGHCTTLAFGVPMLCTCFAYLTGFIDSFTLKVCMMLFVTMVFIISSWMGLEKGMQKLSDWNAYFALGLAAFILLFGPTMFEIKAFTNGIGYMFQNFLYMSLWSDPVANGGFPEGWTAFYWAWWLGLGPWMWIFTVRISRGRTIRQMILGMVICGSLGCWFYFGTVSAFGLFQQLNGHVDMVKLLEVEGATKAIVALVASLPIGDIIVGVWIIVGIMFLATTMDSSSYTLAAAATKNLGTTDHPDRAFKMFWSAMLASLPLGFMFANASLKSLQSLAILTAVPIGFLTIVVMICGVLYAQELFGHLSPSEIFTRDREARIKAGTLIPTEADLAV